MSTGLITRDLGDEIVVIDSATDTAHSLGGLTAQVWRSLEAGEAPAVSDAELATALADLEAAGLVENKGMTRRDMLRRTGTVAVAGSIITIAMPEVMAAASPTINTATTFGQTAQTVHYGFQYNVSVNVAPVGGSGTPTGLVSLFKTTSGTPVLVDQQPVGALFTLTAPNSGTSDTFSATYLGDSSFKGSSTAAPLVVTYTAALVTPTFSFSYTPVKNTASNLVVTVNKASGGPTPTGTITVTSGGANPATLSPTGPQTLDANGQFTYRVTPPSGGGKSFNFHVIYSGNTTYAPTNGDSQTYSIA